jgi:hypothetical protein
MTDQLAHSSRQRPDDQHVPSNLNEWKLTLSAYRTYPFATLVTVGSTSFHLRGRPCVALCAAVTLFCLLGGRVRAPCNNDVIELFCMLHVNVDASASTIASPAALRPSTAHSVVAHRGQWVPGSWSFQWSPKSLHHTG